MSDSIDRTPLLESAAALVLERAADLEAQRGREVSVEDLRAAALDAGIPLDAFERALSEVRAGLVEPVQAPPNGSGPLLRRTGVKSGAVDLVVRRAALGALGLGIAGFAQLLTQLFGVPSNATIQYGLVLAFFVACGLVANRRDDRDVLAFEFDLASLWTGLTLVWMVLDPVKAAGMLAAMALIGAVAGTVGAVLVRLLRRSPGQQDLGMLQSPTPQDRDG